MKFTVTLKSPDAIYEALEELPTDCREEANYTLAKWFEYGEYLTVEIDTDTETIKVLEN